MRGDAGKRKLNVVKGKEGINGKVSTVLISASKSVRLIALVAAN
jgi:hypothetical protein